MLEAGDDTFRVAALGRIAVPSPFFLLLLLFRCLVPFFSEFGKKCDDVINVIDVIVRPDLRRTPCEVNVQTQRKFPKSRKAKKMEPTKKWSRDQGIKSLGIQESLESSNNFHKKRKFRPVTHNIVKVQKIAILF